MRIQIAAAVAAGSVGAAAQMSMAMPMNSSVSPTYVTMTVSDCDSADSESMITVTNGVTVTYCPACESMPHTTVYTTTYMAMCTTDSVWSTTPREYTVTETCTGSTPTWSTGTDHVPQGYTVTEYDCTCCDSTSTTSRVTITEPCGCMETGEAGSLSPAPASQTGSSPAPGSGSGGSSSPGSGSGSGSQGTPSPGAGAGSGSAGSAPQATPESGSGSGSGSGGSSTPYNSTTAVGRCPGPMCQMASSAYPSGASWGNTSGITPFTGKASTFSSGVVISSILGFSIAILAIIL